MCGLLKTDSHDIDWFFQFPLTVQSVASDGVLQVSLQHISNHLLCGECRRMEETLQAMCCPEAVSSRGFCCCCLMFFLHLFVFHLTTLTVTKYFLWYQVILKDVDSLLYVGHRCSLFSGYGWHLEVSEGFQQLSASCHGPRARDP